MRAPGGSKRKAMSPSGHERTFAAQKDMSALPPKADMCSATRYVRFVPRADIAELETLVIQLSAHSTNISMSAASALRKVQATGECTSPQCTRDSSSPGVVLAARIRTMVRSPISAAEIV